MVSQPLQQPRQLVVVAMDFAEDVERPVLRASLRLQGMTFDGDGGNLFFRLEHENMPEAFLLQAS